MRREEKVIGFKMNICFKRIEENCNARNEIFQRLCKTFKQFIEPIYGCQDKFLEKIRVGKDRRCVILINNGVIKGILVYKTKNSYEYEKFKIKNALEIKTLMLVRRSSKFDGLMVAALYKQAALAAINNKADCILATVSSNLKAAYGVAKKLGFINMGALKGKNINGVEELLICHPSPVQLLEYTDKFEKKYGKRITSS